MAPAGRLLKEENIGAVQALLFHLTCWHLGLRYIGGGVHGDWPTQDFGIVLWSRSVAPNADVHCANQQRGRGDVEHRVVAMEARGLRPPLWFGLLEYRQDTVHGQPSGSGHMYRKTSLFDLFLAFDVVLEMEDAVRNRPARSVMVSVANVYRHGKVALTHSRCSSDRFGEHELEGACHAPRIIPGGLACWAFDRGCDHRARPAANHRPSKSAGRCLPRMWSEVRPGP
jgi:hypothetical protein